MRNGFRISAALTAAMLIGGAGYAAATGWRHSVPQVIIDVRIADAVPKSPTLLLIYGEEGSDPFTKGAGRGDIRITSCNTRGALCISPPSQKEYLPGPEKPQSLQVRLFNGNGNPIIGGVRWVGSWHPDRIRVTCDLRLADVQKSCAISEVAS
jgi:hypothetical protein